MNVFSGNRLPYVISLLLIVLFVSFLIPLMLLYGGNGAENFENVLKFILFEGIVIISCIIISIDQLTEKRSFMKFFDSYLHNPEKGIFSKLDVIANPIKLFLLSYVVFGLFATLSVITNTFFIKVPQFQITNIAVLGLSAEPASSAETLLFFAVALGLCYGVSKLIAKKNRFLFVVLLLISILLVGAVAFPIYHHYRYGGQEEKILGVIFFGTANAALTTITGSIIPAWTWHALSNGLYEAKKLFSKEVVILVWSILWFFQTVVIAFILMNWKKKQINR